METDVFETYQIATDKDLLALELCFGEVLNSLLSHGCDSRESVECSNELCEETGSSGSVRTRNHERHECWHQLHFVIQDHP